ncbi:acyltransferase [Citrobacter freundii]|jgi:peptidoglycan/LPS O-acetylase OafA/YrhL|uniref:acyltransferase family protein n=1 Tax=Citrobacter freundii TaxID=546 RepID=UPI0015E9DA09|nr:acyltransferase [Citrobacter freundii]QMB06607.1 acyltransferase [Citrobacter freundii]
MLSTDIHSNGNSNGTMNSLTTLPFLFVLFILTLYASKRISHRWTASDISSVHKHATVDGLRGIAAILVVFHHSVFTFNNVITGSWGNNAKELSFLSDGEKVLLENAGPLAVSIFFMITGFLFFERIISKNAFGDVFSFYKKRALRIVPMYLVSIAVVFICFFAIGVDDNIDSATFVNSVVGWLSFGFLPYTGLTDHFQYGRMNAGVIWTLAIEWKFYAILPLMSSILLAFKSKLLPLIVCAIVLYLSFLYGFVFRMNAAIAMCFVVGAIAAALSQHQVAREILSHHLISIISIFSLVFILLRNEVFYSLNTIGYLALFFIPVACGNSLFRVMKSSVLKMAGLISYSVYLLHGVILNVIYLNFHSLGYATATTAALVLITLLCTISYILVEKRYMASSTAIGGKKASLL